MPPKVVLDEKRVSDYILNPEKYLIKIENITKRRQALQWLIVKENFVFRFVDFTDQHWLFKKHFDFSSKTFRKVLSLTLDNCGIHELPIISGIETLKHLSLSDNHLYEFPVFQMPTVQSLDVKGNPIEEIDFDIDAFPQLTTLTFGSEKTRFITVRVLNQFRIGKLNLFVPEEYRGHLLQPQWNDVEECIGRYLSSNSLDVSHIMSNGAKWEVIWWQLEKNEKIRTMLEFSNQADFCQYLGHHRLNQVFQHPALLFLTDLNISYCELNFLPEWDMLTNLRYADLSGNNLSTVPKSSSLRVLDITKNSIRKVFFHEFSFPKLLSVTAGSDYLKYISCSLLKRTTVTIKPNYQRSLVMPPGDVIGEVSQVNEYLKNPERFMRYVDAADIVQALEWLFNEEELEFIEINLAAQNHLLFKLNQQNCWHFLKGVNLKSVTSINMGNCELDYIPSIENMICLDRLNITENKISSLSTLKHPTLRSINVSENPIEIVRVNFDKCPNLKQIKTGSKRTVGFSLYVLERVSCGSLCIEIVEQHKKNIQLPPQFIVQTDFAKEDVAEYLNSGLFDVSWYSSEESSEVENILSLDEREIHTFKMTNEVTFADQLGSDFDFLLDSSTLSKVKQLNLSDCKMTYVPAFYHMDHLTHVDLSNNRLGNYFEQLQEILDRPNSFPFLSRLNLSRNDLKALPNCSNMPSLNFLDISNNDILSLASLESKCLSHLLVNENPLDILDFDPQKLPSLIEVTFGSEESRFVHFKIAEKASEGIINLRITSHGEQYLMFPRPQVLSNQEKLRELCQCEEISPRLFNTSNLEEQMKCVSRLMEYGAFKHQSLNFSGESLFSLTVGPEELNNWLSKLTKLTHLTLSNCELQEIPDVTELILLQLLDVRHNKITKFKIYPNKRLANIDITENPILGFDFDENSLFGLRCLKLGSERTKYISLQVLQNLRNGLLEIDVSKENLKHLLYPPAGCMIDKESLIELTDKASLDLTQIATHERKPTLEWMLCHSGSMIKTLNLSRPSEVDGLDYENIMEVFEENIGACYNLFSLTAKNLGIRQFPDVAPLSKLHRIDLSDNEIDTITIANVPIESLCELDVSMNPIAQFNAKWCDLKKLQKLRIGSPKLKYICHPLLQKAASGLELFVHETSSQSLRYPPYNIVQNVYELRDFVEKRELSLKHLSEIEKKETINWLFGTQVTKVEFLCLNFAYEGSFCSSMGMDKLNRLLSSMSSLTELNLSNCKLQDFPEITQLLNLKVLNVKNNSIVSLTKFSNKTLAEIDLSGNPILGYNFDKTALPALQCLTIGSTETKYLSLQVLKMVMEKLLELNVDSNWLKHLIYPPEQCFTKKNQLDEFVKTASFDTKLINKNERESALKWVLSHSSCMLRSLSISYSQKTDVSDHSEEVKEVLAIFKEQLGNFGNLQQLSMNCLGLRQMHNLSALSKLIKVDYSHNKINTIDMA